MTPDATDSAGSAETGWWVRTYIVVPLIASAASVGLARIDPTQVALGPPRYGGIAGVVAGMGLVAWTVLTYSRAGETLSPVVQPDRLVTSGPLARTRNPLYLGVVTAISGVALVAESPVAGGYAVLLAVVYHGLVVGVEEPKLEAAFGESYRTYCEEVPRWLPRRGD